MPVVIASAVRTAIGAFQGAFASVPAPALGAAAIRAAVERAAVAPEDVDVVFMGQVLAAGAGQAPARQAALGAGLLERTPTVTLNKMCGSGLEAIVQGWRAITVGDAQVVVAGGQESMSQAPYVVPGARAGLRLGDGVLVDTILRDGLLDAFDGRHMGSCAEGCAVEYQIARADQDAYAARSYRRAQAATEDGRAANEIVPFEIEGRKGSVVVDADEGPAKVDFDKLPNLRPAFDKTGTITAGNASTLNDGAAAVVLMDEDEATKRGTPVRARIVGHASHAQAPADFATAPIGAMRALFDRIGWAPEDVDVFEINEAFAVVPMAAAREFGIDEERLNVLGGAVALGHPIGASGARIVVTLLNALELSGGRRGVAAICIGGGEAWALAVERV
ncbi:MAG: acetyl-CoA C-acyltransferase [Trueperaceae bacterium]